MAPKAQSPVSPLSLAQKRNLRENGFVALRGLVPAAAVHAALRLVNNLFGQSSDGYQGAGDYWTRNMTEPAIMDLLFKTPLWGICESLCGGGRLNRPFEGQVALRLPAVASSDNGPAFHIDGLVNPPKGGRPDEAHSFTMLAAVLLSDVSKPFKGNFTVCPGSHRQIAKYTRSHDLCSLAYGLARKLRLKSPLQITGKAGDALICHYQLAHDKEQNLSPFIRYMAFFRLEHAEHKASGRRPHTDLWREWPGIHGR